MALGSSCVALGISCVALGSSRVALWSSCVAMKDVENMKMLEFKNMKIVFYEYVFVAV